MRRLLAVFGTLSMLFCGSAAAQQPEPQWQTVLDKARGQEVFWNAWGGGDVYNNYIDWVAGRVAEEYGVTLRHVKLGDTAEAVRKVLAERSAGRSTDGAVDLIWINGENFKTMKDSALLYGPFTDRLPNFKLVDTDEKPTTVLDFTVPTDGLESPWGMAKLVFVHDTAVLSDPPKSIAAILEHAKANPGRITYPAPPDFTGTTFLKQALYELVENPVDLLSPAGENFDAVTAPLWNYLDALSPLMWREGRDFPKTGTAQRQLLSDGAVDLSYSFNIGEASSAIAEGLLPDTARTYVLDGGTIGNTHFVAIPFNAAHKDGAMVVANFLLSPEAQARKAHPDIWGEQTVLSMDRLSDDDRALFENLPRGVATLSETDLGKTLPEPHPSWMVRIEEAWLKRYGS
ncbi:ABC transporter substrate-binding protein [Hwanghaeella grinnelliae]|uniref:ABC transporter substrate-binding protein n=1 Tax=Hwanghaeella grinnelliae TaxID=2500179 RepID=A0A3S2Y449_9PROT|nr:ABC transporter substrate-binding protein [Hwanghaeella grinnelliae]RVU38034.1 ABC transporter substrate-binding protein [Hwanghaeella grinnelliae]